MKPKPPGNHEGRTIQGEQVSTTTVVDSQAKNNGEGRYTLLRRTDPHDEGGNNVLSIQHFRSRADTTTMVRVRGIRRRMASPKSLTKAQCENVRARIHDLVEEMGSQVDVARALKLSQQMISKAMSGEGIGLHVARALAHYDGVPVSQVIDGPHLPHALRVSLRQNRRRWQETTLAVVFAVTRGASPDERRTPDDWTEALDELEKRMGPAIEGLRDSGTRFKRR